jgi:hypothetical protein
MESTSKKKTYLCTKETGMCRRKLQVMSTKYWKDKDFQRKTGKKSESIELQ